MYTIANLTQGIVGGNPRIMQEQQFIFFVLLKPYEQMIPVLMVIASAGLHIQFLPFQGSCHILLQIPKQCPELSVCSAQGCSYNAASSETGKHHQLLTDAFPV